MSNYDPLDEVGKREAQAKVKVGDWITFLDTCRTWGYGEVLEFSPDAFVLRRANGETLRYHYFCLYKKVESPLILLAIQGME